MMPLHSSSSASERTELPLIWQQLLCSGFAFALQLQLKGIVIGAYLRQLVRSAWDGVSSLEASETDVTSLWCPIRMALGVSAWPMAKRLWLLLSDQEAVPAAWNGWTSSFWFLQIVMLLDRSKKTIENVQSQHRNWLSLLHQAKCIRSDQEAIGVDRDTPLWWEYGNTSAASIPTLCECENGKDSFRWQPDDFYQASRGGLTWGTTILYNLGNHVVNT